MNCERFSRGNNFRIAELQEDLFYTNKDPQSDLQSSRMIGTAKLSNGLYQMDPLADTLSLTHHLFPPKPSHCLSISTLTYGIID
ncbi:unnamed protein product [Linum trigynum]|uniref:Uncharacterized protein n=1 Tax=Linum trigynum TaxID=586398 RepID=A0AAV2FMQ8_9ROSI